MENLTAEGKQVYRLLSDEWENAPGTAARAGKMTAFLMARHADIYAAKARENDGSNYTALDYIGQIGWRYAENADDAATMKVRYIDSGEIKEVTSHEFSQMEQAEQVNILRQAAMYRNPAKTFAEFRENVLSGRSGKSYFNVPVGNHVVQVFSDDVRHVQQGKSSHPLSDEDWNVLVRRLDSVDEAYITHRARLSRGEAVIVKFEENGKHYGAVLEFGKNGAIYLKTAVAGAEKHVQAVLGIKKGARMRLLPGLPEGTPGHTAEAGNSNATLPSHLSLAMIADKLGIVNNPIEIFQQSAWHGSAAKGIERLDLRYIGTGEGAQVHGYGLYFGADRDIIESRYRLRLAGKKIFIRGKQWDWSNYTSDRGNPDFLIASAIYSNNHSLEAAIKDLESIVVDNYSFEEERKAAKEALSMVANGEVKLEDEYAGSLLQVEIPDNDVLLDEQKRFDEQPEAVQTALRKILDDYLNQYHYRQEGDEYVLYSGDEEIDRYDDEDTIQFALEENKETFQSDINRYFPGGLENLIGREIYRGMYQLTFGARDNAKSTSQKLNDYGIKGITYEGGMDGRCYVVFDDKAVDILERYEQAASVQTAAVKLEADRLAWKETLKAAWKEKQDTGQMLKVMETPLALQMVGAKLLPMYLSGSKLQDIKIDHPEIKKSILNDLPQHLADPMMIVRSKTVPGRLVVCLDLKGTNGANLVVPVELNAKAGRIEANILTSIYSKTNADGSMRMEWFTKNLLTENEVLYVNKEKTRNLYQSAGLLLPLEGKALRAIFGDSIKTDEELVKIKNENLSLYQAVNEQIHGQILKFANGRKVVDVFENADESTMLHELGHVFLLDLENLSMVDETSRKDLATVNEWAEWHKGAAKEYEGTPWEKEFREREEAIIQAEKQGNLREANRQKNLWRQERFARGFERYLSTDHAPTLGLKGVFKKFKEFLRRTYGKFMGDGGKPSVAVQQVMSRMVAEDAEIKRYQDKNNEILKGVSSMPNINEYQKTNDLHDEAEILLSGLPFDDNVKDVLQTLMWNRSNADEVKWAIETSDPDKINDTAMRETLEDYLPDAANNGIYNFVIKAAEAAKHRDTLSYYPEASYEVVTPELESELERYQSEIADSLADLEGALPPEAYEEYIEPSANDLTTNMNRVIEAEKQFGVHPEVAKQYAPKHEEIKEKAQEAVTAYQSDKPEEEKKASAKAVGQSMDNASDFLREQCMKLLEENKQMRQEMQGLRTTLLEMQEVSKGYNTAMEAMSDTIKIGMQFIQQAEKVRNEAKEKKTPVTARLFRATKDIVHDVYTEVKSAPGRMKEAVKNKTYEMLDAGIRKVAGIFDKGIAMIEHRKAGFLNLSPLEQARQEAKNAAQGTQAEIIEPTKQAEPPAKVAESKAVAQEENPPTKTGETVNIAKESHSNQAQPAKGDNDLKISMKDLFSDKPYDAVRKMIDFLAQNGGNAKDVANKVYKIYSATESLLKTPEYDKLRSDNKEKAATR